MTIWYSTCRSSGSAAAPPPPSCPPAPRLPVVPWVQREREGIGAAGGGLARPAPDGEQLVRREAESAQACRQGIGARLGEALVISERTGPDWPQVRMAGDFHSAVGALRPQLSQTHLQLPVPEGQERGGAVGCEACERRGAFHQSRAGPRAIPAG